jgi:ParB-like chromosome segregation protein Spo0J
MVIDGEGTFENLVENLCREDVSPWDLGYRFNELAEAGYTQQEIGSRVGKTQGLVSRHCAIAKGLHPASVDRLNKIRARLTTADLMKVSALLDADKKPDEKAQADMISLMAGTKQHRKRRRATRTDVQKLTRRLNYLKDEMRVPRHAQPYILAVVAYLTGKTRTVDFPEEL